MSRGRPSQHTNEVLRLLALEVKNKLKGQTLNYSVLEKHTGIGRNTWQRRMSDIIEELNSPVGRPLGITEKDEVYFPNIEELFERSKGDINKIKSELLQYETLFYQMYKELKSLRERKNLQKGQREQIEGLVEENRRLKQKSNHYENLYKQLITASAFPHLRDELSLKDNLLSFEKNMNTNASLDNLGEYFSQSTFGDESTSSENDMGSSLHKLKSMFPNIMSQK